MKRRLTTVLVGVGMRTLFLRMFAVLLIVCTASTAGAQGINPVVRDSNGKLLGRAVGFTRDNGSGLFPRVAFGVGGDVLIFGVRRDRLVAEQFVYYETVDCTAAAYLPDPANDGGVATMNGAHYAIGPGNVVYRVLTGPTPVDRTVQSFWFQNKTHPEPPECEPTGPFDIPLLEASAVGDLDNLFIPPYSIE